MDKKPKIGGRKGCIGYANLWHLFINKIPASKNQCRISVPNQKQKTVIFAWNRCDNVYAIYQSPSNCEGDIRFTVIGIQLQGFTTIYYSFPFQSPVLPIFSHTML